MPTGHHHNSLGSPCLVTVPASSRAPLGCETQALLVTVPVSSRRRASRAATAVAKGCVGSIRWARSYLCQQLQFLLGRIHFPKYLQATGMDGQKSYIGQSVFEWSLMEMSLISGCARICYHRNRANWRVMDLRNRPSARRLLLLLLCLCCSTIASCPRGDWLTFAGWQAKGVEAHQAIDGEVQRTLQDDQMWWRQERVQSGAQQE